MDILKRINLYVTADYMEEIEKREVINLGIMEVLELHFKNHNIYNTKLNDRIIYVTEKGLFIHIRNEGFIFFLYKENITDFICINIHNFYKPYKAIKWKEKISDMNLEIQLACDILGIGYENKQINNYKIDTKNNCWECGSLLDINDFCKNCNMEEI